MRSLEQNERYSIAMASADVAERRRIHQHLEGEMA
jgi:hypothetical protein